MDINKELCIFIFSYGKPHDIPTLKLLDSVKYTGDYYIIIGNDDPCIAEYYKTFGDKVRMFDKYKIAKKLDSMDNFEYLKTILYARNAAFDIAKTMDYKYFMHMDDDFTSLFHRSTTDGKVLRRTAIRDIMPILEAMIKFMEASDADCVAMSQGGDFIGGVGSNMHRSRILRKCMNTFIFKSSEDDIQFKGLLNEDVNMYTNYGKMGKRIFTIADASIDQAPTQTTGAITEIYQAFGTYMKSFYSVMQNPSFIKISVMGDTHKRIHHKINSRKGYPMILSNKYKKEK